MRKNNYTLIIKFSPYINFRFMLLLYLSLYGHTLYAQSKDYQTYGVKDNLPVFYKKLADRQVYPLSWLQGDKGDFSIWRSEARNKVFECLLTPPPEVPFDPVVISEKDRGSYVARKVVFNITGDSRVLGFMLLPKSKGPHPAVLLLHDHGGKFDIGKEKVVEPWDEPAEKIASARQWVKECYGGRFFGDELAKLGYVCFVTDMLNWSDREGGGHLTQQALASNMFNLGMSFAGLIAYEDLRAAEFISEQPEVDPNRIAAIGLSVGGYRTWQVAALSEHIAAGVSVCWMSTYTGLMVPGNNHSLGNSAYTMVHPGLSHYLDYPDVASIACPKPMMFCCGNKDDLFPLESIKEAFKKMRLVWESQNAGEKLVTKLYDSPHEFNLEMQSDAFKWLDLVMHNNK
jgi:dienelactone hydrolase